MAYGAALAAGGIAAVSAVEAWLQLQHPPDQPGALPVVGYDALLAIALPVLAVAAVILLSWLARRLGRAVDPESSAAAADSATTAEHGPGSLRRHRT